MKNGMGRKTFRKKVLTTHRSATLLRRASCVRRWRLWTRSAASYCRSNRGGPGNQTRDILLDLLLNQRGNATQPSRNVRRLHRRYFYCNLTLKDMHSNCRRFKTRSVRIMNQKYASGGLVTWRLCLMEIQCNVFHRVSVKSKLLMCWNDLLRAKLTRHYWKTTFQWCPLMP